MSAVLTPSGDDATRYERILDSGPVLSFAPSVNLHCPSLKRIRLAGPPVAPVPEKTPANPKRICSMDALPDECLFEILRRIAGKQERSIAACVSRRWLMLLSSIGHGDATDPRKPAVPTCSLPDLNEDPIIVDTTGSVPDLSRCLEGTDATDAKLAAIAIKSGRELGKLSMRSNATEVCRVTDLGFKAVARCCLSLRTLMVWDAPGVGDDGMLEISGGCPMLEKLDICQCPSISDVGIVAIAERCRNLVSLTVESCPRISDKTLQAIGRCCPKLQAISISCCPLVGDKGVSALVSAASSSLRRIKLERLNVTDVSLGVVGYYGKEVTELVLGDLPRVGERGFWVMGNACGLQNLNSFVAACCDGLTDLGLEAVATSCPFLNQVVIRRSPGLSDAGLQAFSRATATVESVRLEECNRITMAGLVTLLLNCHAKLRALSLSRCAAVGQVPPCGGSFPVATCDALRVLNVRNCPGFGDSSMAVLAKFCPRLQQLDLRGLPGITDAGLVELLKHGGEARLAKVHLNNCSNISDAVVSTLGKIHGGTLEVLSLEGCGNITDASLLSIADCCSILKNLDVSSSLVTDAGVSALASTKRISLSILSLAYCTKISDRGLAYLGNFGWSLIGLNLQNCTMISPSSVGSLEEKMWWCDILY